MRCEKILILLFCSKSVNVTRCDVVQEKHAEHCQVSLVQDFVHVGQQTVHVDILSFADNLTVHNHMLIFYGIIAGRWISAVSEISHFYILCSYCCYMPLRPSLF